MLADVVIVNLHTVKDGSVRAAQSAKGLFTVAYGSVQPFHLVVGRVEVGPGGLAARAYAPASYARITLVGEDEDYREKVKKVAKLSW